MYDFAPHVDGGAEGFKGDFDNVDGAHHAGAKATRLEQQHPFLAGGSLGRITVGDGFEDRIGHIVQYTNGWMGKTGTGTRG